jgi:hypothetical protein
MQAEIKKQWVGALRSGRYLRCERQLRRNGAFCPLGVLCDLHAQATLQNWTSSDTYLNQDSVLPEAVRIWAGLPNEGPRLSDGVNLRSISGMNDYLHISFNEMANLIEGQL